MLLYICITAALFLALLISITDRGKIVEPERRRGIRFSRTIHMSLFLIFILVFWFLTAFRGASIGNDTLNYLSYYEEIALFGVDPSFQIEIGYQYFCLLLSKLSLNPYFLLVVCATICYSICTACIYKRSSNILYSTLLLFCIAFSFFVGALRQAIAVVIVLIAYERIKRNKNISAALLILFASVFHISALVAFLWFFHKLVPKKPLIIISLALVVSVLSASGLLNSLLAAILQEYQGYFDSDYAGTGWLGIVYYALRAVVIYLFIYVAYKDEKKEKSLTISNSILLLITVCLGLAVNLFSRASMYFLLVTVIDLPNAFNSGKIKNRNIWMFILGVVMLAFFIVTLILRPEWNNLYPYEFNWQ